MFKDSFNPQLDDDMLLFQLVIEYSNKRYKEFLQDFKPLVPVELKFNTNYVPYYSAKLHFDYDKAVYLPFEYAGIKLKLDRTFI